MTGKSKALIAVAVVAAIGVAVWWRSERVVPPAGTAPPQEVAPPAPVAKEPASSEPSVQHPVETSPAAPLAAADLTTALVELFGRRAVASFVQTDDFPRRVAATVDNLGRAHAPATMWPVNSTPGKFTVEESNGATTIARENSARYTPFVLLVETVDVGRAVSLYKRMYPLLQQAYEELGFPKRYFNDRLVEIIDVLLATPAADYPLAVQLVEVKGPIPSLRPWVRYEFVDSSLESLTAGQKILLRVGPVNQRRLKSKLTEIRQAIAKTAPAR
ncbi:MAG: hypothetical protein K0Q43_2659 [Ramlibacter sp.]|jgi:hypothetical protein|nr:hypothetical protein [Ramlibacter sp.]